MNTRGIFCFCCLLVLCLPSHVFSAGIGITGKNGETAPYSNNQLPSPASETRTDVEYNTTGIMDLPATQGGDINGWGSHFIARWDNTTGEDISVVEFGWPCGGFWITSWYVWISDTLPGPPGTQDFQGNFLAASEDDTEYPPSQYTYIDVSDEGIVIPAGSSMFFGYANPGMGGQITTNGVETWSYYEDAWDADSAYNRTAVLQFKGEFNSTSTVGDNPHFLVTSPVASPNPFNPRTSISFGVTISTRVVLTVHDLRGHLVKTLMSGTLEPGQYEFGWNGLGDDGQAMSSGTYFVRLLANGKMDQSKISLIR